tara:strand:- start:811 stop:1089 length:279 start_codon:yes stop_codon:yes gene_type:complete
VCTGFIKPNGHYGFINELTHLLSKSEYSISRSIRNGIRGTKQSIDDYLTALEGEQINNVAEVGSGKDDSNRPKLQSAIQLARQTGATIVVSE